MAPAFPCTDRKGERGPSLLDKAMPHSLFIPSAGINSLRPSPLCPPIRVVIWFVRTTCSTAAQKNSMKHKLQHGQRLTKHLWESNKREHKSYVPNNHHERLDNVRLSKSITGLVGIQNISQNLKRTLIGKTKTFLTLENCYDTSVQVSIYKRSLCLRKIVLLGIRTTLLFLTNNLVLR